MAKPKRKEVAKAGNGILFFDPFPDEKNPAAGWGMLIGGRGVSRIEGDFIPGIGENYVSGRMEPVKVHFIGDNGKLYERENLENE